ncbi:30S ribosomal protein S6e [Candidatus Pacearchaeota archaeon]|nr:30S ribosomal protein S6e [Candidatus Pacearchaeota archaeon]
MGFKLNISDKEKAWKLETDTESLVGKNVGDVIEGKEIKSELDGYQLQITGGSDMAGFPLSKNVEGLALKKLLLKRGWGMRDTKKGIRLRKTVRGKQISSTTSQINMKVIKSGKKNLSEIFPEQNKSKEPATVEQKPVEQTA